MSPCPLVLTVLMEIAAHWLASGLPLLLLTPTLAQQYSLSLHAILLLTAMLLIGTSATALVDAVGAALTLGARSGAALLCILALPPYAPTLVLGTDAGPVADVGLDTVLYLSLSGVCLTLLLFVCSPTAAVGLHIIAE